MDYEEEYFNSDADDHDDNVEVELAPVISRPHKHCKILKEEEIRKLQNEDISDVSSVLSVSRGVACTLLFQNNWIRSSVYDKWFSDENNVTLTAANQSSSYSQMCSICCEEPEQNMLSAACGHPFCVDCWKTYISISIQDGPGCLTLKCPEPGCKSNPGLDMVEPLASADDKEKYYRYLYRWYVESNPKTRKWCPAPGCAFAIENDIGENNNQVTCDCGYKLCWGCGEESHSPVDCQTVTKWMEKNNSEAENTTWILAYTKPCPKCKRPIEKNQGCSHMRCGAPCFCSFCWTCLKPFSEHGERCNAYRKNTDGLAGKSSRMKARKHLERYTHYYERWASNDKSRKMALASLSTARNEHVGKLIDTQMQSHSQIMFVVEAWEQIVECRRVLKWTYAYGYYLSESGSAKLNFFEYLQGEAESALERLHHCAEKEIDEYLLVYFTKGFNDFRIKLSGLTSVTKNYFENLVSALENNLSEVEIVGGKSTKKRKLIADSKTTKSSKRRRARELMRGTT